MDNPGKRVGVIGGGIGGLAAAWELTRNGFQVDLFERDSTLGGLAGWFNVNGTTLEKFYHHLYNLDVDLINLIREAGLENNLVFCRTNTGAFFVNKIYRLSTPMDLIKYKPLPFTDRIRMGLLVLKARKVKDWRQLDRISAKDWIIRNSSRRVFDIMWSPLFRSKFGRYAEEVSAAWLWSKLMQRGGSRSKAGAEELGYLRGGYGLLFDTLEKQLLKNGCRIFKQSPVEQIVIESNAVTGLRIKDETIPFSHVIACTQVPDYVSLACNAPKTHRDHLKQIGFLGNATLVMKLNRRLSDTYWVNITDPAFPFVGVIEQTNLLDESHYGGHHLAYISRYMDIEDPMYKMDQTTLFDTYLPWLQKVFPAFGRDWVEEVMLWREPHSQAVVSTGYGDKIPDIRTPVDGLYLSTMAQIFPEDRQMSNGVKLARKAAGMVKGDILRDGG